MSAEKHHDYHLVDPSPWPLMASVSALIMFIGLAMTFHDKTGAYAILAVGLLGVLFTSYVWWRDVIKEGESGEHHTNIVRHGMRIGMALFIVSEVMFFGAFFWSFFKAALAPVLVFDGLHIFDSAEPLTYGVFPPESVETFDPWDLPFLNTLILLLSGTTVTWAHYALLHNKRDELVKALAISVGLGVSFTILQAYEYSHAMFGFSEGIYSTNFYMATGFHGFHVIIGTIFLAVNLVRAMKGGMDKEGHLSFEFAAWYWHFVDVVWIFLFIFVYVWAQ